jgi:copper oxidase (laccase) domain-containing protein
MFLRIPLDGEEIRLATSTIRWGAMGSSWKLTPGASRRRNRFLQNVLKADPARQVAAGIEHGNAIEDVADLSCPFREGQDGLCTLLSDVSLIVSHADCVPIFMWGSGDRGDLVGILHAGWRGVLGAMEGGAILPKAVQFIRTRYGIVPADLSVFLGIAIGPCHFEVSDDVAEAFSRYYHDYVSPAGRASCFVDLHGILAAQAHAAGVSFLKRNQNCTYCETGRRGGRALYFSHRRETHERIKSDQNMPLPLDSRLMISAIVKTQSGRR